MNGVEFSLCSRRRRGTMEVATVSRTRAVYFHSIAHVYGRQDVVSARKCDGAGRGYGTSFNGEETFSF